MLQLKLYYILCASVAGNSNVYIKAVYALLENEDEYEGKKFILIFLSR